MAGDSQRARTGGDAAKSFATALLDPVSGRKYDIVSAGRWLAVAGVLLSALAALRWWGLYGPGVGSGWFAAALFAAFVAVAAAVWRALDRADDRRRNVEWAYRQLVEQLPLVVYVDEVSDNSANIYTSPQVEALLGYSVEEWVTDPELFVKALHDDDRGRVLAEVKRANDEGSDFVCEYRLVAKDGSVVWVRDEASLYRGTDGEAIHSQGYLLDITRRRFAEEELRRLAVTDPLTSLPNRRQLLERLQTAAEDGRPQSLLFLDVDDFKTFNDILGHRTGDSLLVAISERLVESAAEDELVVRLGGDEFAVWTPRAERPALEALACSLLDALAAPFEVDGLELRVHASVGIATGETGDELLRDADLAMYEAKARGGNKLAFFEPRLQAAAEERLRLALPRLTDAVDEDAAGFGGRRTA